MVPYTAKKNPFHKSIVWLPSALFENPNENVNVTRKNATGNRTLESTVKGEHDEYLCHLKKVYSENELIIPL